MNSHLYEVYLDAELTSKTATSQMPSGNMRAFYLKNVKCGNI
jgi:hypothetical protein